MGNKEKNPQNEKKAVALSSVFASIFLTGGKLAVGLATGSLGILSEAAHSALDLGAAVITYFAVSMSDKPADREHHYGHGKIENFSALIEALLLLLTCVWIIYEAVIRLKDHDYSFEISYWGFAIMIVSIIVDFSRARALNKAAKKYNSQALEADALHFSSDILSSSVVIVGLVFAKFGYHKADPIAALVVAALVIIASIRLAKETVDGLMDRAPEGLRKRIESDVISYPGVKGLHKVRVRQVGARVFGDLHVLVDGETSVEEGHRLADEIEERLSTYASDMVIHIEPNSEGSGNNKPSISRDEFKKIVEKAIKGVDSSLVDYHQLSVHYDYQKGYRGNMHLVIPKGFDIDQAYKLVRAIEEQVDAVYPKNHLDIRLEPCDGACKDCRLTCDD